MHFDLSPSPHDYLMCGSLRVELCFVGLVRPNNENESCVDSVLGFPMVTGISRYVLGCLKGGGATHLNRCMRAGRLSEVSGFLN